MRRSMVRAVAAALLAAVVLAPGGAPGTSFNPLTADECAVKSLSPGAAVFLFHSGTDQTRRSVRAGDVLTALRSRMNGSGDPAGALRVDAAVGERCFRGRVLEGELRVHDLVSAGSVFYLVLDSDAPCLHGTGR